MLKDPPPPYQSITESLTHIEEKDGERKEERRPTKWNTVEMSYVQFLSVYHFMM